MLENIPSTPVQANKNICELTKWDSLLTYLHKESNFVNSQVFLFAWTGVLENETAS